MTEIVPAGNLLAAQFIEASVADPVTAYLSRLPSPESKRTVRGCLDRLARLVVGVPLDDLQVDAYLIPWHQLTYQHTNALRSKIMEQGWVPGHQRKHLSALRQVLRECWRSGLMDADTYQRAVDLAPIPGRRLPAGRALPPFEVARLIDAALSQANEAKALRDASMIATAYSTGGRRSELVRVDLADFDRHERMMRLLGKGNRERENPLPEWACQHLDAWLVVRASTRTATGPLWTRVHKSGQVLPHRLTPQSVADIVDVAVRLGRTRDASPHDFRRSYISEMADRTDLLTVMRLAGHASAATTSIYDRRGSRQARAAVDRLADPHGTRP